MIRSPAGFDGGDRIKRYLDYYQPSYGVMMLSAGQFSPASLFAAGEQGAWYDPSDFSTMFQDAAGTTPVTAVEQPVGLLLDKSKGLALGSETVINGDCSSSTGWISGGAGWTITGGQLVMTAAAGSGIVYQQYSDGRLTAGKTYKVTFDIVSVSAGSARIDLWGATTANGTYFSTTGTKTCYIVAPSAPVGMQFTVIGPFTGTIDNISVRELPGNHASQSTAASRPVLSARVNQLTYSEQFDNAAWTKTNLTSTNPVVTPNDAVAPDGTLTADKIDFGIIDAAGDYSVVQQRFDPTTTLTYIGSVYVKAASAGDIGKKVWLYFYDTAVQGIQSVILTSSYQRIASTSSITSGSLRQFVIGTVGSTYGGENQGAVSAHIWGADLRVTNVGVNLPAYQRVAAATGYDTSGFPLYLKFDGVDDSLATGTIDPGAVDKAQVFAGVRKLSDAARGCIVELGNLATPTNGSFFINAPLNGTAADYSFTSAGTSAVNATYTNAAVAAPITSVVTGLGDILGDNAVLRINGTQRGQSTSDQGTGNYLSYPLYIGRRGGSSLPFNGNLYSMIVRFSAANLSDAQIASTETWVNGKTGAY